MSVGYIIIGKSTGPSRSPVHHRTLDLAKSECERLARKHPSETFTIYRSCASACRSDVAWTDARPADAAAVELDDDIPF